MKHFDKIIIIALFLSVPLTMTGCWGSKLATEFVSGVVTLDDKPLADASVFFNPKEGGVPAVGTTDAEGKYVITAMQGGGQGKGTVAGEYVVTVSKPEVTPAKSGRGYTTKQLLPMVYMDPLQSPFPVTVIKGENYFDIPLKSNPGIEFKDLRGLGGR